MEQWKKVNADFEEDTSIAYDFLISKPKKITKKKVLESIEKSDEKPKKSKRATSEGT